MGFITVPSAAPDNCKHRKAGCRYHYMCATHHIPDAEDIALSQTRICLPCALSKKHYKLPSVHQHVSFAIILLLANMVAHRQCTDGSYGIATFAQMYQCSLVDTQYRKLGSPSLQDIRQPAMPM